MIAKPVSILHSILLFVKPVPADPFESALIEFKSNIDRFLPSLFFIYFLQHRRKLKGKDNKAKDYIRKSRLLAALIKKKVIVSRFLLYLIYFLYHKKNKKTYNMTAKPVSILHSITLSIKPVLADAFESELIEPDSNTCGTPMSPLYKRFLFLARLILLLLSCLGVLLNKEECLG